MAKISVIIPVYNVEQYLSTCLDSVLNQTYQDLEVILVDDGSVDCSLAICQDYAQQDKRVKVIHQENKGSTAARKNAVDIARGEYISFIDSDDWVDSCFYEEMNRLAENYRADIVVSGCVVERGQERYQNSNKIAEGFYDKISLRKDVYPQMLYFEDMNFFSFGILQYLWNKLYKRSLIISCLEHLDERIYDGEDVACVFEACLKAESMVIDNHCWYHYRIHDNSICTSKRDEKYFMNAVYLYHYMEQIFQNSQESEIMLPQLKRFICAFVNNGMRDVFGCMFVRPWFATVWELPTLPTAGGSRVILYGAGKVGISYYKQLLSLKNIEIAAWVDSFSYGKKIGGVVIESPEVLRDMEWDYILVAVNDSNKNREIVDWLIQQGIEIEKIFCEIPRKRLPFYEFQMEM